MNSAKSRRFDSVQRRGHSMMEMIVVMSVLAGMAALSWPMMKSPMNKLRLQAAAQEVSAELSKARLKAMQSGVPQVFRYQANTGKFQVTPASDDDSNSQSEDEEPAASSETSTVDASERSPLSDDRDMLVKDMELPDGICFDEPCEEKDESGMAPVTADSQGWTDLAVFYPNGNTTSAVIGLKDFNDLKVDVKLSGLTGSAKIGEAHRQELK